MSESYFQIFFGEIISPYLSSLASCQYATRDVNSLVLRSIDVFKRSNRL